MPRGDAIQDCFTREASPVLARLGNGMKKKLKWIFGALVAVFVLLQFTNPARINPPAPPGGDISAANPPPPQIAELLRAACYDCHSDETRWPWYSHFAPVSWLVVRDVNDGREWLNFSDWPRAVPETAAKRLDRISEELDYREMPPKKYTFIHAAARLTDDQRKSLIQWADQESEKLNPAGAHP